MTGITTRLKQHLSAHPVGRGPTGFPFHLCPPCSPAIVADAEAALGFRLPDALRDIYTTIGNGGFGPGYGVMGVAGGFTDDLGQTIETLYAIYRTDEPDDPTWQWPQAWIPICHWGCVIYSAVDCSAPPFPVSYVDVGAKEPGESMSSIIHPHKPSLESWLADWLDGKDLWKEVWG